MLLLAWNLPAGQPEHEPSAADVPGVNSVPALQDVTVKEVQPLVVPVRGWNLPLGQLWHTPLLDAEPGVS